MNNLPDRTRAGPDRGGTIRPRREVMSCCLIFSSIPKDHATCSQMAAMESARRIWKRFNPCLVCPVFRAYQRSDLARTVASMATRAELIDPDLILMILFDHHDVAVRFDANTGLLKPSMKRHREALHRLDRKRPVTVLGLVLLRSMMNPAKSVRAAASSGMENSPRPGGWAENSTSPQYSGRCMSIASWGVHVRLSPNLRNTFGGSVLLS